MKVINLSSWAGRSFDIAHGALIEMPEDMAQGRIAAGLARVPTDDEVATLELKPFPGTALQADQPITPPRQPQFFPKGKRR